jgi:glycosyltransferase involved in cell wall biosynthesis
LRSHTIVGLPVLEAMSYGAPVIASNASPLPEAGGDAAAYVPPGEPRRARGGDCARYRGIAHT